METDRAQDVEDWSTMEAGRELDALVAERVMGWRRALGTFAGTMQWKPDGVMLVPGETSHGRPAAWTDEPVTYLENLPRYCTDIAAAWEVVERMAAREWDYEIRSLAFSKRHRCAFHSEWESVRAVADTAPLAIVRAALAALTSETPKETR